MTTGTTTSQMQRLIGLQRICFARAASYQTTIIVVQALIGVASAAAVYIPEGRAAYSAAIIAVVLGIGYAIFTWLYKTSRNLAERITNPSGKKVAFAACSSI